MARGRRAGRTRPGTPQRRCVGCRTSKDLRGLLRIGLEAGAAVPRAQGGRGCYICRDPRCATAAARDRQISRALSRGAGPGAHGAAAGGPEGRARPPREKVKEPGLDRLLEWIDTASPLA